jgi:hypothetical protein
MKKNRLSVIIQDSTTWLEGDYELTHNRETYQPTTRIKWDRVTLW